MRKTLLAANYDFRVAKAYFGYGINKGLNSSSLAAANPFGSTVAPTASMDGANLLLPVSYRHRQLFQKSQ